LNGDTADDLEQPLKVISARVTYANYKNNYSEHKSCSTEYSQLAKSEKKICQKNLSVN